MTDSAIERLKQLDQERAQLLAHGRKEALDRIQVALADLRSLGFAYEVVETQKAPRRSGNGAARRVKDAECPICKFKTAPPHDARKHRGQGTRKRPFTPAELERLGFEKA